MLSNERNGITVEIQQRANAFSENYSPQTDRQTDRQNVGWQKFNSIRASQGFFPKGLSFIFLLFFIFSCSKDAPIIEEKVSTSRAEIEYREGADPEVDCKCYMRVDGASNYGNLNDPSNGIHNWSLIDATLPYSGEFEVNGRDNLEWYFGSPNIWKPFPTGLSELHSPSNGTHMFYLVSLDFLPANPSEFTVHTTVKCYIQETDGSETLGSTTYHDFVWKDGGPVSGTSGVYFVPFWNTFSCLYQTEPVVRN